MKRLPKKLQIGLCLTFSLVMLAVIGFFCVTKDHLKLHLEYELASPSALYWLGNGENGIDVFMWILAGLHNSFLISVTCTLIGLVLGTLYGTLSAFLGGKIDHVCMRITDTFLAFPGILLAIYLSSILVPGMGTVIFALSMTNWIGYARLCRGKTLELKQKDFILATKAMGAPLWRVVGWHLIPNMMGPILIQASFGLSGTLIAESTLTFLGLGLPLGTPSIGSLLDQGAGNLMIAPHLALFPGVTLALCAFSFQMTGEGLREYFSH